MRLQAISISIVGSVLFFLSYYSSYVLPVRSVWFGQESHPQSYPLSTVHHWEEKVKSMDWVDHYKLTWVYPNQLNLSMMVKDPVAKLSTGEYMTKDTQVFHLPGQILHVPTLTVSDESFLQAVALIQDFSDYEIVRSITQSESGLVEVLTEQGNIFILSSLDFHPSIPDLLAHYKGQKFWCNLLHSSHAACRIQK